MITSAAIIVGSVSVSTLLTLSLAGLLVDRLRFWPPPKRKSWQYRTFWVLFRIFIVCLVTLCIVDFNRNGSPPVSVSILGWTIFAMGFGLASFITGRLGWENAHGEAVDLRTSGWFSVSRNPIYVASIFGMIGLSLAINSTRVSFLLLCWALMYVLAPFAEEPWLLKQYGKAYRDYCNSVPRFLGRTHKA